MGVNNSTPCCICPIMFNSRVSMSPILLRLALSSISPFKTQYAFGVSATYLIRSRSLSMSQCASPMCSSANVCNSTCCRSRDSSVLITFMFHLCGFLCIKKAPLQALCYQCLQFQTTTKLLYRPVWGERGRPKYHLRYFQRKKHTAVAICFNCYIIFLRSAYILFCRSIYLSVFRCQTRYSNVAEAQSHCLFLRRIVLVPFHQCIHHRTNTFCSYQTFNTSVRAFCYCYYASSPYTGRMISARYARAWRMSSVCCSPEISRSMVTGP